MTGGFSFILFLMLYLISQIFLISICCLMVKIDKLLKFKVESGRK